MIIRDFRVEALERGRRLSAAVEWEGIHRPADQLRFEIEGLEGGDPPDANAFLLACFPPASLVGEARIRVEARLCPMLVEGLQTVAAWWDGWGLLRRPAPQIESPAAPAAPPAPRGAAVGFLSGGVDSLHMLMRNRRLYDAADPARVRDAILVHGFDIGGKREHGGETQSFAAAARSAEEIAAALDLRLARVSTNLRHLPSVPGFWRRQQHGAAMAAVGHAATARAAHLFVAGTYDVRSLAPWGSHPLIDPHYSTQRLAVIHDGVRFSRLDKVRELAGWPHATSRLRVCSRNLVGLANCGTCEKCIRTRLEFLVVGTPSTEALGDSRVPPHIVTAGVRIADPYEAACYKDLVEPLRSLGFADVAREVERKLADFAAETAMETA